MLSRLDCLLAEPRCLIADGGMGTALYARGLANGAAPELWLTQQPAHVASVHQAFASAGCDILLTNSFGANRCRLSASGLQDQTRDLNVTAGELARAVADTSPRNIVVAGSVGPLWSSMPEDAAVAVFAEQMHALKAGRVDLIWIETMSDLREIRAAGRAVARTGLPFVVTASFDGRGLTLGGLTPGDIATACAALDPPPIAIGCNCGDGPGETAAALIAMRQAAPDVMLVAKSNAGLPTITKGLAVYAITPEDFAQHAQVCRGAGARIIGGCCGTTFAHIMAIRRALDLEV